MGSDPVPTHVDVLIIGAGISGIGAAAHLRRARPQTRFAVVEAKDAIGGTWHQFRYPGARTDSDMATYGYAFKPWHGPTSIATADRVLNYLNEVIQEYDLTGVIHCGQRVIQVDFDRSTARWDVALERTSDGERRRISARYLFAGVGYYDLDRGYTPALTGLADYEGIVVHPQHWPSEVDLQGKRVVVIGSGSTAVTMVPALAQAGAQVSMLQRSAGYVISRPASDPLSTAAQRFLGQHRAYRLVRARNIALARHAFTLSRRHPALMRRLLISGVRRQLPEGYDVATHFTPRYAPWDQRVCICPDGDLFAAIRAGQAEVVTDTIDTFTRTGIQLASGRHLNADIVVTATGLRLLPFGGITIRVDGEPVRLADRTAFRAMMLDSVPNLVFVVGYPATSWTLKVDLVAEHFVRLLDHLDATGNTTFEPVLPAGSTMTRRRLINLNSGYINRAISLMPHGGSEGGWQVEDDYTRDVARLRRGPLSDPDLKLSAVPTSTAEPGAGATTGTRTAPLA